MKKYELLLSLIRKYYSEESYDWQYPFRAEHDQIYTSLGSDVVSKEEHDLLLFHGWFVEDDCWSTFT